MSCERLLFLHSIYFLSIFYPGCQEWTLPAYKASKTLRRFTSELWLLLALITHTIRKDFNIPNGFSLLRGSFFPEDKEGKERGIIVLTELPASISSSVKEKPSFLDMLLQLHIQELSLRTTLKYREGYTQKIVASTNIEASMTKLLARFILFFWKGSVPTWKRIILWRIRIEKPYFRDSSTVRLCLIDSERSAWSALSIHKIQITALYSRTVYSSSVLFSQTDRDSEGLRQIWFLDPWICDLFIRNYCFYDFLPQS